MKKKITYVAISSMVGELITDKDRKLLKKCFAKLKLRQIKTKLQSGILGVLIIFEFEGSLPKSKKK